MHCLPLGERALALCLDNAGTATIGHVRALAEAVAAARPPGLEEIVASPGRVTVMANDGGDMAALENVLATIASQAASTAEHAATIHDIPVAYDGPDRDDVCSMHRIDRRQLVALHTQPEYVVEAISVCQPGRLESHRSFTSEPV
jgi:allophanate hydrolase subunit 1